MTAYELEDIKKFMASLFTTELFDDFFVSEVEVKTYITTRMNGVLNKKWFQEYEKDEVDEYPEFIRWKQIKSIVYDLIKGKRTPECMNISFTCPIENGDSGGARIHFQEQKLQIITAYNRKEFSLDKSKEREWDERCEAFLKKNEFPVSTQLG